MTRTTVDKVGLWERQIPVLRRLAVGQMYVGRHGCNNDGRIATLTARMFRMAGLAKWTVDGNHIEITAAGRSWLTVYDTAKRVTRKDRI